MADLPDVNVWIALIDPEHRHHEEAKTYWKTDSASQILFCRITMLGFLRLCCQSKVMTSGALTPSGAWSGYLELLARSRVLYINESSSVDVVFQRLSSTEGFKGKHWTDAYLAAFAIAGDIRLVSFDADFPQFPCLNFLHLTSA